MKILFNAIPAFFLSFAASAAMASSYDLVYTFDATVTGVADISFGDDAPEEPAPFSGIYEGLTFAGSVSVRFEGGSIDGAECALGVALFATRPDYCGGLLDSSVTAFDKSSGGIGLYFSDTSHQSWLSLLPGGSGEIVFDAEWTPEFRRVVTFALGNISVTGLDAEAPAPVPLPGGAALYLGAAAAAAGFRRVARSG